MINIIGLLILISGFSLPYLNASIPSTYFFWLGGLLSLNKGIIIKGEARWAKWAQIGILINIILVICMLGISFLSREGSITTSEYRMTQMLLWISSPASAIGETVFPYPQTHHLDGSVSFQISYSRTVITAFLNVCISALLSVLIGMFWEKRKWKKQNSEHFNQPDAE